VKLAIDFMLVGHRLLDSMKMRCKLDVQ